MSSDDDTDDLTAAERHLVSRILNEGSSGMLMFELAYLVPSLVLVVIGFVHRSNAAFAAAFSIVVAFRLWMLRHDRASMPVLKSAVGKLCAKADRRGT